jgi:hypothetical protein
LIGCGAVILESGEFIATYTRWRSNQGTCEESWERYSRREASRVLASNPVHGHGSYTLTAALTSTQRPRKMRQSINQFKLESESQLSSPTLPTVELRVLTDNRLAAICRSRRVHTFFARSTFVEMCMQRWSLDFWSGSARPSEQMTWDFKERFCFRARAMRQ